MLINTHRPWEGRISPPKPGNQTLIDSAIPADSFVSSSPEKPPFSMAGFSLLALTALTGVASAQAPPAETSLKLEAPVHTIVTADSLRTCSEDGYQNPDDWKELLYGGFAPCERPSEPRKSDKLPGYQNPDDWKADLGGQVPTQSTKSSQKTSKPHLKKTTESKRTLPGGYQNPDDWKEKLGGSDSKITHNPVQQDTYRGPDDWKWDNGGGFRAPQQSPRTERQKQTTTNPPVERYQGPDSWKEELGGGNQSSPTGSSSSSQSDWQNPDDWKSSL